jgi:hypothetical protein
LSRAVASGSNTRMDTDADTQPESGARRSDRWAAETAEPSGGGWAIAAVVLVLAGYGVAALVVAALEGSIDVGDDLALVLVAVAPSLGALGLGSGIVGARRRSLRWLAWIGIVLGALLVLATIAAVTAVVLAMRSFS